MPLDGVTSYFLSRELNEMLNGGRVEKITQPNPRDLILRIRKEKGSVSLLISANPSDPKIYITTETFSNPAIPLRFCTILRKYLTGARILSVESLQFERIFRITFQTVNEIGDISKMCLISEIMGRHSNIIFVNESDKVLDAIFHVDFTTSRVREILPARPYISPPAQKKLSPSEVMKAILDGSFYNFGNRESSISKYMLNSISGFSPLLSASLCIDSGIDIDKLVSNLDKTEMARLSNVYSDLISVINSNIYSPTLLYFDKSSDVPSDFHALSIAYCQKSIQFPSISSVMDEYYRFKNKVASLNQQKEHLRKQAAKKLANIERKIEVHLQDIADCGDYETLKKYGDLIYANMWQLNGGEKSILLTDFYSAEASQILVPLNENLSPARNAQQYFKKFQKFKSKYETVTAMLVSEKQQKEYLDSLMIAISNAENNEDISALKYEITKILKPDESTSAQKQKSGDKVKSIKKATSETAGASLPRRFISSEGIDIYIGRNNIQNETLTFKTASHNDIWMHVQKEPGTHTIIKCSLSDASQTLIQEAAMLTAWYSKKPMARDTKTVIDYCLASDVRKIKGGNPGHVTYRNFKSIIVDATIPQDVIPYTVNKLVDET